MSATDNMPMAAKGLISYRCQGRFGWIMIGAKDDNDAMNEALRSSEVASRDTLEVWDGSKYVSTAPKTIKRVDQLEAGDKVSGTYFDVPFTGSVSELEGHTGDWNYYNVYVTPDQPIMVYGSLRDGFMILSHKDVKADQLES